MTQPADLPIVGKMRFTEVQKETLIKAYVQSTDLVCMDQLNKFVALGLFDLIHQPFRDWVEDWPAQTEQLLARVEALFAG